MELPTEYINIGDRTRATSTAQCADVGVAGVAPSAAGAPPSNKAPAICTSEEVTILLTGIDSLYVSYRGCLLDGWDARLDERKQAAQSEKPSDKLQAQLEVAGHMFVVHDRGRGPFAYVISDNWFDIALARPKAKSVPVAYVQISSEALLLEGCVRIPPKMTGCFAGT